MKKVILILSVLFLVFMMFGCGDKDSVGEKNINGFLNELYQVENTDDYRELAAKVEAYFKEEDTSSQRKEMSAADGAELYNAFLLKYENYCSEAALENLIANGYITKYDQQAWEEACKFYVKEIVLEQAGNETYHYTIQVEKRLKDNTVQLKSGAGTIKLNREKFVDWFKITKELKDL